MAVTIKLPFFEDQVSVTVAGYSEAGSLLQSSIALTESAVPGLYTGSLSFATFPAGYYDLRIYIGAATVASASWAIRVTADGTTAEYADSIGELRRWATNQTEHDATQARLPAALVDGRMDSNISRWNGSAPGNLDSNGLVPGNTAAINGNTTAVSTFRTWLDNNRLDAVVSTRASEANATANTNALGVVITAGFVQNITEHNATQDAIQALADDTSGALIVLPNAVDGPERSTPAASDVFYLNESGLFVKQIKDTDGNPVDLSGFSLLFVAEIENGLDKFSEDSVTVGGTGDSYFTVTIPSDMTSKDGRTLIWSLRDRTDGKRTVLGKGKIVIEYAPDDLSVT
jgi:hypothetical protein